MLKCLTLIFFLGFLQVKYVSAIGNMNSIFMRCCIPVFSFMDLMDSISKKNKVIAGYCSTKDDGGNFEYRDRKGYCAYIRNQNKNGQYPYSFKTKSNIIYYYSSVKGNRAIRFNESDGFFSVRELPDAIAFLKASNKNMMFEKPQKGVCSIEIWNDKESPLQCHLGQEITEVDCDFTDKEQEIIDNVENHLPGCHGFLK